jgi:uncharacterized protein (TIGR00288 family)
MPTAIFVDGNFFRARFPTVYRDKDKNDPALVAKTLHEMALDHLTQPGDNERKDLYRIFVYDYPPLTKKAQCPISALPIDFSQAPAAVFRSRFHQELTRLRKVVLRLGHLEDLLGWRLLGRPLEQLLNGERRFNQLTDQDFEYNVLREGVDLKMGLDIASIAYKKQADQIVLVTRYADFVPAAKLARREGIDFVLDPMWINITNDLHEHIDGLRSTCPRPPSIKIRKAELAQQKEKAPSSAAIDASESGTSGAENITPLFK